jgi:hypothetical protein
LKIAGSLPLEDLPELPDEGEEGSTTTKSDDTEDGRATGVGPMSDGTNDNRDRSTDA